MATGVAKRDRGGTRGGHNKPGQLLVRPGRSSRKRRRSARGDDDDEETTAHRRKSPRIQEILNKQHQEHPRRAKSKSSRRSPRLRDKQDANGQRTTRGGRQTTSSPTLIKTQQCSRQRQAVNQYHSAKEKDEGRPTVSFTNLGAQKSTKRQRCVNGDESNHDAKRPRHSPAQCTESRTAPDKENFIEDWLDDSCWSRRASTENEPWPPDELANMPNNPPPVLPSPANSFEGTITTSRKSERSAASVHDADYHQSLRYRNIFIERENPPLELMRKAQRIVLRSRTSPEMDDATVQKLKDKSRRLRNEAEDVIIKQLAPHIIPAIDEIPDQRLEMNADQPWFNSVPVPLDPDVLTTPLPLPKPKPDLSFGYSQAAFNHKQLMTIDLLVDDQFGRSYAVPDQKIRFPFLGIEFKSQAKNGTHYIATNQAAGAGAIALNGHIDLIQRSFGMEKFDYDEPQYFSISMDHELARINVHWVGAPAEGGQHTFHVEGLSQHLLRDANGIQAVSRAIKNILDHGADTRLRTLCSALDAYRETVVRSREVANAQRKQGHEALPEPQSIRRTRRTVAPIDARTESAASCENKGSEPVYEPQRAVPTERAQTTARREMRDPADVPANALENSRNSAVAPAVRYSTTRPNDGPAIPRQTMSGARHVRSYARPRRSFEDGKNRRQIRPTQKVLDNADGNRDRRR